MSGSVCEDGRCLELVRYAVLVRLQSPRRFASAVEIIGGASPSDAGAKYGVSKYAVRETVARMRSKALSSGCVIGRAEALALLRAVDKVVRVRLGGSAFADDDRGVRCRLCGTKLFTRDPSIMASHIMHRHPDVIDELAREVIDLVNAIGL